VYVHCFAHSLNLSIQQAASGVPLFRDVLQCMYDLSVVVRGSDFRPKLPFISEFKRDVSTVTIDQ